MIIKGLDILTKSPVERKISSNEVQEAIISSLKDILSSVREVLGKCPPELSSDILDNGIILTGGGSLIKSFDKLIENSVNVKVNIPENPLDSVVIGGAYAFNNKKLLATLLVKEN